MRARRVKDQVISFLGGHLHCVLILTIPFYKLIVIFVTPDTESSSKISHQHSLEKEMFLSRFCNHNNNEMTELGIWSSNLLFCFKVYCKTVNLFMIMCELMEINVK